MRKLGKENSRSGGSASILLNFSDYVSVVDKKQTNLYASCRI